MDESLGHGSEKLDETLRGSGLWAAKQAVIESGVGIRPPADDTMTVRCRCGWEFTGPAAVAQEARRGHLGRGVLRRFEPENKSGGRPWNPEFKTAMLRSYRYAQKHDWATAAEIREGMQVDVQVQRVVRYVAPWATYATRTGVAGHGGDSEGAWTWRSGCLAPPAG